MLGTRLVSRIEGRSGSSRKKRNLLTVPPLRPSGRVCAFLCEIGDAGVVRSFGVAEAEKRDSTVSSGVRFTKSKLAEDFALDDHVR